MQTGFTWQIDAPITAELGVVGMINQSNSRRLEYDAIALRSVLSVPLTLKSYVNEAVGMDAGRGRRG